MKLTSKICNYDETWTVKFAQESELLTLIFGSNLVDIQHIGSTSVPGLAAKPEIDVLAVVKVTADYSVKLKDLGYRTGGDLSEGHQFYKKDRDNIRTHKLHVCVVDHPKITEMLLFRDILKARSDLRARYGALKLKLEQENIGGIAEYLNSKEPFIKQILAKNGC